MRLPLLLALPLAAAIGAAAPQRAVPAATPAGKAEDCLPISRIRETRVRSDRVIDFVTSGRRIYRNTLPQSCPGLGFEQRFTYATSIGQLCSVDVIRVLYTAPIGPGGACGLGKFQPVTLAR